MRELFRYWAKKKLFGFLTVFRELGIPMLDPLLKNQSRAHGSSQACSWQHVNLVVEIMAITVFVTFVDYFHHLFHDCHLWWLLFFFCRSLLVFTQRRGLQAPSFWDHPEGCLQTLRVPCWVAHSTFWMKSQCSPRKKAKKDAAVLEACEKDDVSICFPHKFPGLKRASNFSIHLGVPKLDGTPRFADRHGATAAKQIAIDQILREPEDGVDGPGGLRIFGAPWSDQQK